MKDLIQHESIHNDGTVHWLTPPNILASLGRFDLDPCASPLPRPWATAQTMWTLPETDGLLQDWFGRVWLNPPYGNTKVFAAFMERMAKRQSGIALVFARTDARWFRDLVYPHCHAVLFLTPRLTFYLPDGSKGGNKSGAPSILVAYSKFDADTLYSSGLSGSMFFSEHGLPR